MSKSRLENFLYALYSLDSSDLPNPLSRIEELYKCLVTGEEVPTFEPLSRVEKYLMAILGGYDVDSLPNPLSRVEVLLYKLATGDDNLDDVKSFLSEHEELLAEIIRNGSVGGNIDIEYVLYSLSTEFNTLYNTAEKPVKSAILKGNTLVNYLQYSGHNPNFTKNGGMFTLVDSTINTTISEKTIGVKDNTLYTVIVEVHKNTITGTVRVLRNSVFGGGDIYIPTGFIGTFKKTFTTNLAKATDLGGSNTIQYTSSGASSEELIIGNHMVVEGDCTNEDIPYFEGMSSVKMPVLKTVGKNLFDVTKHIELKVNNDGSYSTIGTSTSKYDVLYQLEPNTDYILSFDKFGDSMCWVGCRINGIFSNNSGGDLRKKITTDSSGLVTISFGANNANDVGHTITNIQLEKSSMYTSYEPYKSNILTVNEGIELRGIGDVQDELNLLTGELTERIGEVVLDGSEEWILSTTKNNTQVFNLPATNSKIKKVKRNGLIMCDKLKVVSGVDEEIISLTSSLYIGILKSKASTVEELKVYLSQNPIAFIHEFVKGSIKTVDLSVVNQDGNNTELSTFNDITHVTLSSEALIPEAELEVATKNKEVLSTLSLEMDDISTAQTTLEKTSDAQSENVDATMIATTEIYEGLL